MKQYKIKKLELDNLIKKQPLHDNFIGTEWKKFIKLLITDRPSTVTKLVRNRFPKLFQFIFDKFGEFSGASIYCFTHEIQIPKCSVCKIAQSSFDSFNNGFKPTCKSIRCKNNNPITKNKIKETNLKRYGGSCSFNSEKIKEKIKNTNIKKYGADNPFASPEIKEKIKKTNLERFGVENVMLLEKTKEKIKNTCLKRFGVEHSFQSDLVKSKSKETCLKKFNVENAMQNPEVLEKSLKNAKRIKLYEHSDGAMYKYQGYEDVVLKMLLLSNKSENIVTDRTSVPSFKYEILGLQRIYFPDIFVKSEKLIIEVKSLYTVNAYLCKDELLAKAKSVINAGFNFELIICSKKSIIQKLSGEKLWNYLLKNEQIQKEKETDLN